MYDYSIQKMTMNSYKIMKEMLFLIQLFFIVGSELMLYVVFNDYSSFIDRITSRLAAINILYVKMFQAFALNNSLIDDKTNNKLLKFTDNAPWSSSDINIEDLVDFCTTYNIILPNGFEYPINAGMISLVFKGYERESKRSVILKIKRKNIDIKLNDAIQNLQTCLYLLSYIPIMHKYQITEVIKRNIDIR